MSGITMDQALNLLSNAPATALLAFILYFLWRWLPKWLDRHFAYLESLTASHEKEVEKLSQAFKAEQQAERQQCKEFNAQLCMRLDESTKHHTQAIRELKNYLRNP